VGRRILEGCYTTKTQSTVVAMQRAIQSAVIKATQLGFTSIIKGIEHICIGGSKTRNSIGITEHSLQISNT